MAAVDNKEKKEFLWGYRDSLRQVERLKAEIEELHTMRSVSAGGSSTGRKGWKSDLSEHMARLDSLEKEKEKEIRNMVRSYERIGQAINKLEDTQEKDVLFYRYIKGLTLWEISEKMHYSDRWARKLHERALAHLEISKRVPSSSGLDVVL